MCNFKWRVDLIKSYCMLFGLFLTVFPSKIRPRELKREMLHCIFYGRQNPEMNLKISRPSIIFRTWIWMDFTSIKLSYRAQLTLRDRILGEPDLIRWALSETGLFLKSLIQSMKRIPCEEHSLLLPLKMKGAMWQGVGGFLGGDSGCWLTARERGLSPVNKWLDSATATELGRRPEPQIRAQPSHHLLRPWAELSVTLCPCCFKTVSLWCSATQQ